MDTKTALVTYDDYRHLPNDGKRYEIIEGELYMTPAPNEKHQNAVGNIYYSIRQFLGNSKAGKVYVSPFDVVLSMTDVVEPDVLFIANKRSEIITKKNIVAAPDLVIEVLSESTKAIDRNQKKALYERFGVREYWIVSPEEQQIEQYVLRNDAFKLHAQLDASEKLASEVIEGFVLLLPDVFAD